MAEYEIYIHNKQKIIEFISQQPNLLSIQDNGDKIYCDLDQTADQSILFKQEIADRLFQIDVGNNTFENTLPKLSTLQGDGFLHGTELSITKTNIGTAFIDVYNDYGGRNFFVDLMGYTKIRYFVNINANGSTGTLNFRIVDNGNVNNVLLDVVITNGQNVATVTIPDPLFKNFRGRLRFQAKSTVAGDDPIFDRILIYGLMPNRL